MELVDTLRNARWQLEIRGRGKLELHPERGTVSLVGAITFALGWNPKFWIKIVDEVAEVCKPLALLIDPEFEPPTYRFYLSPRQIERWANLDTIEVVEKFDRRKETTDEEIFALLDNAIVRMTK